MGRTAMYTDRVRLQRTVSQVIRGEVIENPLGPVTDWIPCLYRAPRGRTEAREPRTSLPEGGQLIMHHTDASNNLVVIKQGDLLELELGIEGTYAHGATFGTYTVSPHLARITGEIVETRAKRLLESFQLDIQLDKEF